MLTKNYKNKNQTIKALLFTILAMILASTPLFSMFTFHRNNKENEVQRLKINIETLKNHKKATEQELSELQNELDNLQENARYVFIDPKIIEEKQLQILGVRKSLENVENILQQQEKSLREKEGNNIQQQFENLHISRNVQPRQAQFDTRQIDIRQTRRQTPQRRQTQTHVNRSHAPAYNNNYTPQTTPRLQAQTPVQAISIEDFLAGLKKIEAQRPTNIIYALKKPKAEKLVEQINKTLKEKSCSDEDPSRKFLENMKHIQQNIANIDRQIYKLKIKNNLNL